MNWRDLFLGAFVTLIVTVIAGVAVYYLTAESSPFSQREKLVYDVDNPVTFDSGQTTMSFFNVRVTNDGQKSATNVVVGIQFDDLVTISDSRVSLSSGPAGEIEAQSKSDNQLKVDITVLTPGETVTIAILTDTVEGDQPTVGVKSDMSIGEHAPSSALVTTPPASNAISGALVPIAVFLQFLLLVLMRRRVMRVIKRYLPTVRSVNNTAFVLLHGGLTERALGLLADRIEASGAEPIMLANYGLALGLQGEEAQAKKVIDAAEFWASGNSHEQAVVAFNRSLLAFRSGDDTSGVKLMRSAFEMSKNEIARYAEYSTIVASLRGENRQLDSLLKEQGLSG